MSISFRESDTEIVVAHSKRYITGTFQLLYTAQCAKFHRKKHWCSRVRGPSHAGKIFSPHSDCPAPLIYFFNFGALPIILRYITHRKQHWQIHANQRNKIWRKNFKALLRCWDNFSTTLYMLWTHHQATQWRNASGVAICCSQALFYYWPVSLSAVFFMKE